MNDDEVRATFYLRVESRIEALEEVSEWLDKLLRPFVLGEELRLQYRLILDEGFINVVTHAHKDLPPTTPVDLEAKVFANYIDIRIWDLGQPFNLDETLQTLLKQHSNPLEKSGGRGLIFMYKLTDELRYSRTPDNRNCLFMRKNLMGVLDSGDPSGSCKG